MRARVGRESPTFGIPQQRDSVNKTEDVILRTAWVKWRELPWGAAGDGVATTVQLCERMLESAVEAADTGAFLRTQLPEVGTEFSAQWSAILARTPRWEVAVECGRHADWDPPHRFFEEALDREAGGCLTLEAPAGWKLLAVPLQLGAGENQLLVLAGRNVAADALPSAVAVGRTLALCLAVANRQERNLRRIDRLRTTLRIASSFAGAREMQPLLELIAEEATRLLECDRASIFIWDREHSEVVACPALGVEGGTLRLPDNVGIVGEVISTGRTIRVDDPYNDPRFNKQVDQDSGYTTRNLLCGALRDYDGQLIGAFEVINKNVGTFTDEDDETLAELGIQAAIALQNTREREQLVRSHQQLTEQVTQGVQIIGNSPAVQALRATVERLAATDLPVLLLGESGTGKEVVSQALHYHGPRADRPFVAVNCAALTETLLESELFGHEQGAFTDAREMRQGKFELAEGGTLFLDEIGDMSLGGQAKLLRVLEQKVVTRVGGSQSIPIDVRVLAATNANLAESVRNKRFREDLYYRLSVVTLELPPLRERPEDILALAEFFLKKFSEQARRRTLHLTSEARRRLQAHAWPGNIRELRNLMERVAFLTTGDKVHAEDLAFILSPDRGSALDAIGVGDVGLNEATREFQQEYIRRCIKRVKGNMSEAAKLLGLHRSNLYRKMRQLGMSEGDDEEEF
jgi:transcriptional regulator with GAF, ATPase, and Fis domain